MNKPKDYDGAESEEGGYRQPVAGPCILGVVGATVQPSKQDPSQEVLFLQLDIAEGPFKNYYRHLSERLNKDVMLRFYQGTDGKSLSHFKGVVEAFEESNGFKFSFNEKEFVHKRIGGNLKEEEYLKKDQTVGSLLKVSYLCSIQSVKNGEHKALAPKKLVQTQSGDMGFTFHPETNFNQAPEEEGLPF